MFTKLFDDGSGLPQDEEAFWEEVKKTQTETYYGKFYKELSRKVNDSSRLNPYEKDELQRLITLECRRLESAGDIPERG